VQFEQRLNQLARRGPRVRVGGALDRLQERLDAPHPLEELVVVGRVHWLTPDTPAG
jgi:hypothetical protein